MLIYSATKVQHGIVGGFNFGSGDFFGVLLQVLGIFLGLNLCPHLHLPLSSQEGNPGVGENWEAGEWRAEVGFSRWRKLGEWDIF